MAWINAMMEAVGYSSQGYDDFMKEKALDYLEYVLTSTEEGIL